MSRSDPRLSLGVSAAMESIFTCPAREGTCPPLVDPGCCPGGLGSGSEIAARGAVCPASEGVGRRVRDSGKARRMVRATSSREAVAPIGRASFSMSRKSSFADR